MNNDKCPICGLDRTLQCKCARSDMQCKNGHHWHRCLVHNKLVIGKSDHSSEGCSCTAKQLGELPQAIWWIPVAVAIGVWLGLR